MVHITSPLSASHAQCIASNLLIVRNHFEQSMIPVPFVSAYESVGLALPFHLYLNGPEKVCKKYSEWFFKKIISPVNAIIVGRFFYAIKMRKFK